MSLAGGTIDGCLCWNVTGVEMFWRQCADAAELPDTLFCFVGRARREGSPRQGGKYCPVSSPWPLYPVGDAGRGRGSSFMGGDTRRLGWIRPSLRCAPVTM